MSEPVLILGAHAAIGRALAHVFARAGHPLLLAARQPERLEADRQDLSLRYQVPVSTWAFDALDIDSHAAFYAGLAPRPAIVICVFGLMHPQAEAEGDWALAAEMLAVNFTGAASILHHVAQDLAARQAGGIIGISSVAGDRGRASNYYYGSAKAGFSALLSGLRNRLYKQGVHVLTVKPGFVRTPMTEGLDLPGLLTAEPGQVARAVYRAWRRRRAVCYTRWMWRPIMRIIRSIPEPVFKRLSL